MLSINPRPSIAVDTCLLSQPRFRDLFDARDALEIIPNQDSAKKSKLYIQFFIFKPYTSAFQGQLRNLTSQVLQNQRKYAVKETVPLCVYTRLKRPAARTFTHSE